MSRDVDLMTRLAEIQQEYTAQSAAWKPLLAIEENEEVAESLAVSIGKAVVMSCQAAEAAGMPPLGAMGVAMAALRVGVELGRAVETVKTSGCRGEEPETIDTQGLADVAVAWATREMEDIAKALDYGLQWALIAERILHVESGDGEIIRKVIGNHGDPESFLMGCLWGRTAAEMLAEKKAAWS